MADPTDSSRERKRERAETVEEILDSIDPALEEHSYPVRSEELAAQYGSSDIELPNETESLGSVFDRLEDDEYDSPMAVKEAVLNSTADAQPEPELAGGDREPQPGTQGAPEEVLEDLESDVEVASEAGAEANSPIDEARSRSAPEEAADVGTETDVDSDAEEPGDQFTPDTTEEEEFAPQETVEDRDREDSAWDVEEPGDPAEPTAEPGEAELEPEDLESDVEADSEE